MTLTTLGKYELLEELGRGGFGTVYRARDTILDVERAVKVLHPALVTSPEFIERFRREGRLTARLEHPHIVPVYELGEADGRYFLAMKYLPGGSLKDVLAEKGCLPFEQAVEITRQIAEALNYAYNQPGKLIHRDLKPGNILFESLPNGETKAVVRLSDFGFAKALAEAGTSSASSASGGMLGTPAYMAPEVWRGKSASPAADQYALACVLYEMLIGQALFQGDTPPEIMTKHVLDGPQFPAGWPQDVPAGMESVLRRALTTKPEERYLDVVSFSAACAGLLVQPVPEKAMLPDSKIAIPVPASVPMAEENLPPKPKAALVAQSKIQTATSVNTVSDIRWWKIGGMVSVLVVLLAVAGFMLSGLGNAPANDVISTPVVVVSFTDTPQVLITPTVQTNATLTAASQPDIINAPVPTEIISEPGLGKILFTSNESGNNEIYLLEVDNFNKVNLTNNPANDRFIAISPDGEKILFYSDRDGNEAIFSMAINNFSSVKLGITDVVQVMFFDNQRILILKEDEVFLVNTNGDHEQTLIPKESGIRISDNPNISFSNDREKIYLSSVIDWDRDWDRPHYIIDVVKNTLVDIKGIEKFNSWFRGWSLDDSRLIFNSSHEGMGDIYVANADGSNFVNLTKTKGIGESFESWASTGTEIVFSSDLGQDRNNIFKMKSDGSNIVQLTDSSVFDQFVAMLSDDRIIFNSNRDTDNEIYIMNLDGSDQRNITLRPGRDRFISLSPDEKRLIFCGNPQGPTDRCDLYIVDIDGTNKIQLTNSVLDGYDNSFIAWVANFGKILFTKHDRNYISSEVFIIDIDGTNLQLLGKFERWWDVVGYP